jgi:hypothetical protein
MMRPPGPPRCISGSKAAVTAAVPNRLVPRVARASAAPNVSPLYARPALFTSTRRPPAAAAASSPTAAAKRVTLPASVMSNCRTTTPPAPPPPAPAATTSPAVAAAASPLLTSREPITTRAPAAASPRTISNPMLPGWEKRGGGGGGSRCAQASPSQPHHKLAIPRADEHAAHILHAQQGDKACTTVHTARYRQPAENGLGSHSVGDFSRR